MSHGIVFSGCHILSSAVYKQISWSWTKRLAARNNVEIQKIGARFKLCQLDFGQFITKLNYSQRLDLSRH
jgi:hypothetical protein